jgi:orotate phosphoribosyltransferase-like protein
MSKHFGEKIIQQVLELKEQGYTRRQIGEKLGFEFEQIKELLKRYYRNQRKGAISTPKGRPRCRALTTMQEKDLRIKQLEREVELYRSFLQAAGRM